jgi:hypothetical protein
LKYFQDEFALLAASCGGGEALPALGLANKFSAGGEVLS